MYVLDLAAIGLGEEKADMGEVVNYTIKPMSREEKVLAHLCSIDSVQNHATHLF